MQVKKFLTVFIFLAAFPGRADSPGAPSAAAGELASLQQVRYWCSERYTRVVFDLDREVDYKVGRVGEDVAAKRPARIYVDLRDTLGAAGLPKAMELTEGPVQGIRSARYDMRTTRVVLDLRHAEDYNVFRLEGPFRIVLDLWWKKDGRGEEGAQRGGEAAPNAAAAALPLVVIDPGHGGRDPGAIGKGGLKEKDVVLRIALHAKSLLEGQKKAKVVLTRDADKFIPLERRAWIANSRSADLFVSIHVNAHPNRSVDGVETYYLDNTTDRAARRVAALENATPDKGLDDLSRILIDLRCNANAWESNELAHTMQEALVGRLRTRGYGETRNLGAKGSLFYVLIGAHMPSVLVEVAFITNAVDEKRLKLAAYQKALGEGIASGIAEYLERRGQPALLAKQEGG
jgi:N-acetylmuramoyl-L-alanine amidase